jgi:hypothetical protein
LAPSNLRLLQIEVPEELLVERCDPEELVAGWNAYPAPSELQDFGSRGSRVFEV